MAETAESSNKVVMEQTRAYVIKRLLTTQDDGSGAPRRDISVLAFGDLKLCRHHHLDTVDLLVASALHEDTMYELVKERLSNAGPWDRQFQVSRRTGSTNPQEIRVSSSVFVRVWYKCSEELARILARYRSTDRWFAEPFDISDEDLDTLNEALVLDKATNEKFRRIMWKCIDGLRGNKLDYEPNHNYDVNSKDFSFNRFGSLKVCFDRRIPRFDIPEALELDKKMAGCAKDLIADRMMAAYQPRRWRTKANPDRLVYIVIAPEDLSIAQSTDKIKGQLGAVSVDYSPTNTHNVPTDDLVADFNLDYQAHAAQIASPRLQAASTHAEATLQGPFPDAEKAYNRIRWDASINERNVEIHYEDRHAGVMVKPFAEWVAVTEEEEFIPMHRIRAYVRISDGRLLWDRARRINRLGEA